MSKLYRKYLETASKEELIQIILGMQECLEQVRGKIVLNRPMSEGCQIIDRQAEH